MVDIIFRTLGPWGSGKGANLQPSEVDTNFWNIAVALSDLATNPTAANGIASITVSGTQMTIYLDDGTVMGPFTLPVLMFRWRGDWQPSTSYAVLDVFTVPNTGIYCVIVAHTSGATFDPALTVGGQPAYNQLFGSADASLSTLGDVQVTSIADGDVLRWVATAAKWENSALGTIATQNANAVAITGGTITGMPVPANPSDVATKAYADALPGGATSADGTMMSNISGATGPPHPNTLSDYLDHVLGTTVRGTIMFRGASGWVALAPGVADQFLQTKAAGADPVWSQAISGVMTIYPGAGIDTGGTPIVSTGTVSLAAVADSQILANISGASAAPAPVTLSAFLDHVLGSARGTVLTRSIAGWVALTPGTSGQYLKTQGSGADLVWDSPAGSGTVISVSAGTGITTGGSPITSAGTVALAAVPDGDVLANTSGSSAAPVPTTLSLLWDHVFGSAQGSIVYRGATNWVALAPGTSGQFLQTTGATGNPLWAAAPGGASVAAQQLLANLTASTALPSGHSLSDVLDYVLGSSRGLLIFRGASGWAALSPGTTGQVLTTGGVSSDPHWTAASAGALAGLSDVSVTSLSDHDLLEYVAVDARWENKSLSSLLDAALSATQGAVAYRGAAGWVALAPGLTGQALLSGGASANPSWGSVSASLPSIADATILANTSGASAVPVANTLSAIIDHALGSTRGMLVYRGASLWNALAAGTSGQVLTTGGTTADPSWASLPAGPPLTITAPAANDTLVYNSGTSQFTNVRPKYNIGCYVPGAMTSSQNLLMHKFSKAVTINGNFASYLGHVSTAGGSANATGSTAITADKATAAAPTTFSNVGSITIAAGTVTATFATVGGTALSFAAGDVLRLRGPATADATFADFMATIVGFET